MIGTGYVGLVSGACFAEFGAEVVCVDKDADKIDCLNRGEIPIYEPELDSTVEKGVRGGRGVFYLDADFGEGFDRDCDEGGGADSHGLDPH